MPDVLPSFTRPATHPTVFFINAITSSPQVSEQHCYDDEAAAFDAMVTYQPFNNTRVRPDRCAQVHCPRGCRTGPPRSRPVQQEPPGGGTTRTLWRCPKCLAEYEPGGQPAITSASLASVLAGAGLDDVSVGAYGSWPVVVTGIFPADTTAGLHVVRVAAGQGRAIIGADPIAEPLWLGLFEPDARDWVTAPIESHEGMTVPQIRAWITGQL